MTAPRRRLTVLACVLAVLMILSGCSGNVATVGSGYSSDPKRVTISVVNGWDEGIAAGFLWKQMLEQRGYTVTMQHLDSASAAFQSVSRGQSDLFFSANLPATHRKYWEKTGDKLDLTSDWNDNISLNMTVPAYMTDVNTIADVKAKRTEFNSEIVGIESGSGLATTTQERVIPGYGLQDFTLRTSSTAAMLASLRTAVAQQKPVLVTLWKPHWAYTDMPLKVLKDPEGLYGAPDHLRSISPKGWAVKKPEVGAWVREFAMTTDQINELELAIQQAGKGNEQLGATRWLERNQAVTDRWFTRP
ncbi:glycine betaine ABC transporter substrate-binding protein [Pseudonocardia phyllosphaerae]|uniref:glycine betaine ABC transporter substrate-binding protein n=1 Tax=Pseudonocardia phyllosphaerae TaxID=3390502 RepID=UPI00397D78BD